ncbi:nuclear transport factor 2 family protein [Paraburkholderia sp. BCC1886]|uniref:nuclear transport factor 2 family protein n=1 Tax=Paraburkholderia sp. BCC1886 TaxID=2562670 RepID=UPI0011826B12|nr:nuclear transport factor 2 family protein [Paraburkholderia sp. BCC1886]
MSAADDRDQIRDLLAEYCFLLDGYQLRDFAALFSAQGEWLSRNGNAKGPAAIERLLGEIVPVPADGTRRKHFTANIRIRLAGDTAEVMSNFMVVRESPQGPVIAVAGRYEDSVLRAGERWLFQSRRLHHDITGESGLMTPPG